MLTDTIQKLIDRNGGLFSDDMADFQNEISREVRKSSFLVLGGAGTIGQSVCKEIFRRNPKVLHVIDISENNLVELVRDIRSSFGYIEGDFRTFSLDIGSIEFDALINHFGTYDYVMNLSALKHVRSEEDPYTLMRMIDVNILNTDKTLAISAKNAAKKYFCVSTDKATNPVNMMGCSKRIMEKFLVRGSMEIPVSSARFANVAFSDGSLLHGFNLRIQKRQPISAPNDIKRYFITPKESGELCLFACILGENREIIFPKLDDTMHLISLKKIACDYIRLSGYEPVECKSEIEARSSVEIFAMQKKWPCYFSKSTTTGEKNFEEFYTENQNVDTKRYKNLGVILENTTFNNNKLVYFQNSIEKMKKKGNWEKQEIINLFKYMVPEFDHKDTGEYLDSKM